MSTSRILKVGESYTFSKIFELPFDIKDILSDLGYDYARQSLSLPQYTGALERLPLLLEQIQDGIRYVNSTSEQAKREFLVAPAVRELCRQTQTEVRVDYPVAVSEWLRGSFDYYFENLLIIEAKRDNLNNGFTQLAAELIALGQWTTSDTPLFYGAVTTGVDWLSGTFDRTPRLIT